jgi:hypothetical protein
MLKKLSLVKLSLVALVLGIGIITAVATVPASVNAVAQETCPDGVNGWVKTDGVNATSTTGYATGDKLIAEVCYKASTTVIYFDVTPPAASVEITSTVLNQNEQVQDISHYSLRLVDEESVASASVSKTPATCETGEVLVYGAITNATYDETSTPDGTTGPADYEVVAIADEGAEFTGESTFTGTLDGPLTGTDCVLGETDPDPEVLPNTSGSIATTVLAGLVSVAAFAGLISLAVRSTLTRQ